MVPAAIPVDETGSVTTLGLTCLKISKRIFGLDAIIFAYVQLPLRSVGIWSVT